MAFYTNLHLFVSIFKIITIKIYNKGVNLDDKNKKIAVIGLGYVGMPLAIEFAKHFEVIGYDIDGNKIKSYQNFIDPTGEIGKKGLKRNNFKIYFR